MLEIRDFILLTLVTLTVCKNPVFQLKPRTSGIMQMFQSFLLIVRLPSTLNVYQTRNFDRVS